MSIVSTTELLTERDYQRACRMRILSSLMPPLLFLVGSEPTTPNAKFIPQNTADASTPPRKGKYPDYVTDKIGLNVLITMSRHHATGAQTTDKAVCWALEWQ